VAAARAAGAVPQLSELAAAAAWRDVADEEEGQLDALPPSVTLLAVAEAAPELHAAAAAAALTLQRVWRGCAARRRLRFKRSRAEARRSFCIALSSRSTRFSAAHPPATPPATPPPPATRAAALQLLQSGAAPEGAPAPAGDDDASADSGDVREQQATLRAVLLELRALRAALHAAEPPPPPPPPPGGTPKIPFALS
jgi:hypothetical protein